MKFLDRFSESTQISIFMKFRLVFHTDEQTGGQTDRWKDRTKLITNFSICEFAQNRHFIDGVIEIMIFYWYLHLSFWSQFIPQREQAIATVNPPARLPEYAVVFM